MESSESHPRLVIHLAAVFLVIAILPVMSVGYLAYRTSSATIQQNIFAHLASVSDLKRDEFDVWLSSGSQMLEALAQRPSLLQDVQVLIGAEADADTSGAQLVRGPILADSLMPFVSQLETFDVLNILDVGTGKVLVSTKPDLRGRVYVDSSFFIEGKRRTYVEPIAYQPDEGLTLMRIATPIRDTAGQTIAVLVGRANLAEMNRIVATSPSNALATEVSYLVSSGDHILAAARSSSGLMLTEITRTEGVAACLDGETGQGIYLDYRGIKVMGAYQWIPSQSVCMLTEVDVAEAFAPIRDLQVNLLRIAVVIAAVAVVVALITGGSIIDPLRELSAGAQAIARGDLQFRVRTTRNDELGDVGRSFNVMAEKLQRSLRETAHSQHLLTMLDRAAENVQRAHLPQQVYQAVGDGIRALGFHALVAEPTDKSGIYRVSHVTFDADQLQAVKAVAGSSVLDHQINPMAAESYRHVFGEKRAVFEQNGLAFLRQVLPSSMESTAWQIADILHLREIVIVPMVVEEHVAALLEVIGQGISAADVPAISAFANQAAIALENARLYAEIRDHASTLEARVQERTEALEEARLEAVSMMEAAETARETAERANTLLQQEMAERTRAQEALAASNQELEQFAYIASHDLQEPLRKVQAFGGLLESRFGDGLDSRAKDYLGRMTEAARRGQRMVNDLLDFSRVATRARPFEQVDLARVTSQVIRDLEVRIEQAKASVEVGQLPTIDADPTQLTQVLTNLLGNALKYRTEERMPHITISAALLDGTKGERCEIRVADNGIGFDMKYLDRIFLPFQRLHSRSQYEGSGIGLAICQKIVTRHGGTITAESELGHGATFIVNLPTTQVEDASG